MAASDKTEVLWKISWYFRSSHWKIISVIGVRMTRESFFFPNREKKEHCKPRKSCDVGCPFVCCDYVLFFFNWLINKAASPKGQAEYFWWEFETKLGRERRWSWRDTM